MALYILKIVIFFRANFRKIDALYVIRPLMAMALWRFINFVLYRIVIVHQCSDAVGWAMEPVIIVPEMTYYASSGTPYSVTGASEHCLRQ